jgi:ribosomal protein S18 acetylase RimI-like enzyme
MPADKRKQLDKCVALRVTNAQVRCLTVAMEQVANRMQHELTFRSATAADFAVVLDLATQLARQIEEEAPPLTARQFEMYYLMPHAPMRLLLAVRDDRVVGMISWTLSHELYSADTRVYISDLSVDRAARGQGIGTALMAEVKTWARAHNASKLGWEVWHRNVPAMAFYERMGASIDGEAISYVLPLGGNGQ